MKTRNWFKNVSKRTKTKRKQLEVFYSVYVLFRFFSLGVITECVHSHFVKDGQSSASVRNYPNFQKKKTNKADMPKSKKSRGRTSRSRMHSTNPRSRRYHTSSRPRSPKRSPKASKASKPSLRYPQQFQLRKSPIIPRTPRQKFLYSLWLMSRIDKEIDRRLDKYNQVREYFNTPYAKLPGVDPIWDYDD